MNKNHLKSYSQLIELAEQKLGNKYTLILLASKRARDLQQNLTTTLLNYNTSKYTPIFIALLEIIEGLITKDYFLKIYPKPKKKKKKNIYGDINLLLI